MRRTAALALTLVCTALAGCGGGDQKSTSALDDAVGYFSKDAPFVAAVTTDPNGPQIKQVESLVGRLPVSELLTNRLQILLGLHAARWDSDIRPQLGAPLVVGLLKPAAGRRAIAAATVVAIRVKHPLEAKRVILSEAGFRGTGKAGGVRIYSDTVDGRYIAIDGPMLVAATDRGVLEQALAIKRSDNRMRATSFSRDLAGLPATALVSVSADPRALLGADPRLRPALGVTWISALRRLGAVVKAIGSGLTLDFRVATDPASISEADLPLAPGRAQRIPLIGRSGELQVGVREPSRLARLAIAVWRTIAPARAALVRAAEPRGMNLEQQVPRHLGGTAAAAVNLANRAFGLRIVLKDPAEVRTALGVLGPRLPELGALFGRSGLGLATPSPGENFYAVANPGGGTVVFGVVGNSLVASDQAQRAAALAAEPTHFAPGAIGAAVVTLDARELAGRLLAKLVHGPASLLAPLAVASLRDFTGALAISRSALSGHFKLTIVR